MNTIKNIHKIDQLISARDLEKLEEGAKLHLRHSNISFKIMGISANGLFIKTEQGKHLSENYADEHRLIELTKDLFGLIKFTLDFNPGDTLEESGEFRRSCIMVHAYPFKHSPVDHVDYKWVNEQMLNYGVRVKDIQTKTGIDKTSISAWINNKKPMSQIVKAMLFNFFTVYAIKDLVLTLASDYNNPYYIAVHFDKELITKLVEQSNGFKIASEDSQHFKITKS